MCNSFSENTCSMLAVLPLNHCPNQGHCSFVFVVNFEQVLSFDYYSHFPNFYYHHYLYYLPFTSVVIIIGVFFYLSLPTFFVPST